MKKSLQLVLSLSLLFLFRQGLVYAQDTLSPEQIERVKTCKHLIEEIDTKSFQRTVDELENSRYPELNLKIMEAMTRAYADIVRENQVKGLKNKQWLYSMITLNMANLQFGGGVEKEGRDAALNRFIQRKLKEHLPADIINHPGFSKSVE